MGRHHCLLHRSGGRGCRRQPGCRRCRRSQQDHRLRSIERLHNEPRRRDLAPGRRPDQPCSISAACERPGGGHADDAGPKCRLAGRAERCGLGADVASWALRRWRHGTAGGAIVAARSGRATSGRGTIPPRSPGAARANFHNPGDRAVWRRSSVQRCPADAVRTQGPVLPPLAGQRAGLRLAGQGWERPSGGNARRRRKCQLVRRPESTLAIYLRRIYQSMVGLHDGRQRRMGLGAGGLLQRGGQRREGWRSPRLQHARKRLCPLSEQVVQGRRSARISPPRAHARPFFFSQSAATSTGGRPRSSVSTFQATRSSVVMVSDRVSRSARSREP